jgi:TonB family protein
MGRVYRAFDPLGHRTVAIKTVRPEFLTAETAEEYLRRFRREAQAAGALSHPCIITIFDVGENYFVMELLDGATLQAVLRTRGSLPLAEALPILGPVAEALDYAHARGIIHRDIKPGNLMILPDGRTKIMDFGVAHLAAKEMSVSGQFLGSPAYMAPERILRGDATPLSDLFSFAVVAYESLTGRKPFHGNGVSDVVTSVVKAEAPAPTALNPSLPPAHDEVFHRALAKDPAARYPSAAAFFSALAGRGPEAAAPLLLPAGVVGAPPSAVQGEAPLRFTATDTVDAPADSATLVDAPEGLERPPTWRAAWRLGLGAALILLGSVIAGYVLRQPAPASSPGASVTAPAPPGLAVETIPAGARVVLDGVEQGPSPLSLANLAPGPHTVKVLQEGFAETELSLELAPGMGDVPLRLTLQPLMPGPAAASTPLAPPQTPTARVAPTLGPQSPAPSEPAGSATPGAEAPRAADTADAPSAERSEIEEVERGPDVTAPVRISGEPPRYPELARPLRLRGSVTVEMTVTENGEPTQFRILQSASPILESAVLEALETWRFRPAEKNGQPVRYRGHRVSLTFKP